MPNLSSGEIKAILVLGIVALLVAATNAMAIYCNGGIKWH